MKCYIVLLEVKLTFVIDLLSILETDEIKIKTHHIVTLIEKKLKKNKNPHNSEKVL